MIRKNTSLLIVTILLIALFCTGCGSGQSRENIELGMAAVEALDYNMALEHFEKAVVNNEEPELLYRGQGLAYMGLSQYADAVVAFEKALTYSKMYVTNLDYDVNYYLATAYYKNGEFDKAIKVYDAILNLQKKDIMSYYLRGIAKLESNDFDGAVTDFDTAVSLNPTDYSMIIDVHCALAAHGYKEKGIEYLQAALDLQDKSLTDYDKGRIAYYMEDYENARNLLEQAKDNDDPDTILMLGRTYEALGDYNYAASVYTNYLAKDETHPEICNQLGLCKLKVEDYNAALLAFQSGLAIEDNPLKQKLQFNEIVAYEYMGEFKKAAVLMETYLKLYPDDTTAKREYEFLKTR
ncbi:MAG: tetratricopeptide repeat protein [Lachnospiraceae bacterium]|nr:tetratricopeptide repeat protein [Lachnospiraceae bacterium]